MSHVGSSPTRSNSDVDDEPVEAGDGQARSPRRPAAASTTTRWPPWRRPRQASTRGAQPAGDAHDQPSVHACCGGSPAASAKATSAATAGSRSSAGIRSTIARISARRTSVTSSTTLRPPADNEIVVSRRLLRSTARRTSWRSTSRSHSRVAVDGWMPERLGEVADAQRTARGEHDERPVLRQRHVGRRGHASDGPPRRRAPATPSASPRSAPPGTDPARPHMHTTTIAGCRYSAGRRRR